MVLIISFVNYEILIRLMYMQKKKTHHFFFSFYILIILGYLQTDVCEERNWLNVTLLGRILKLKKVVLTWRRSF
jgi:hypothetical protein